MLDTRTKRALSTLAGVERFKGQKDRTLIWQGSLFGGLTRVMTVGVGSAGTQPAEWRLSIARGIKYAGAHSLSRVSIIIDEEDARRQEEAVRWTTEALLSAVYRFKRYKSKRQTPAYPKEALIGVLGGAADDRALTKALKEAKAAQSGVSFARDLVNEPANILSPAELANRAENLAKQKGLAATILDKGDIEKMGMNLLMSVAAGSHRPPKLIHLSYQPKTEPKRVIALVGKGVTFDSGGLCIKPPKSMYEMKTDMAGAAVVLGVMSALKALNIGVAVHGIIPATDNTIGGSATRPGDVFTARSGKTVEIFNTDAEGRLILGDALTYACELKPNVIIDFATLTGACEVALGSHRAGLFAKRDEDADAYLDAAQRAGELLWRLPLAVELESGIKSDIADITNTGPRWGGAITAALFLQHFTGKIPWMHMDIAGPARADKTTPICPKGGTGFGVLSALEYLRTA
jgi:leucyl aminopeptidase